MATATMTRTDEQIQLDVLDELKWDARVHPNESASPSKTASFHPDRLGGHLHQEVGRRECCHRVHGVKAVANDLEVRLPSSAERTDTDIAAAATRAWNGTPLSRSRNWT